MTGLVNSLMKIIQNNNAFMGVGAEGHYLFVSVVK